MGYTRRKTKKAKGGYATSFPVDFDFSLSHNYGDKSRTLTKINI